MRNRSIRALLVAGVTAVAIAGSVAVAGAAPADAGNPCRDESVAQGDVGNDFGPGLLFVGVDGSGTGDNAVCVTTGGTLPGSNESVVVNYEDPRPTSTGQTVAVEQRSCTDHLPQNCRTTTLVGQTGADGPRAAPGAPTPAGTVGGSAVAGAECLWVFGSGGCDGPATTSAYVRPGDAPSAAAGGCVIDGPVAGCEVPGAKVTTFGAPGSTASVTVANVDDNVNGEYGANPESTCIGLGTTC